MNNKVWMNLNNNPNKFKMKISILSDIKQNKNPNKNQNQNQNPNNLIENHNNRTEENYNKITQKDQDKMKNYNKITQKNQDKMKKGKDQDNINIIINKILKIIKEKFNPILKVNNLIKLKKKNKSTKYLQKRKTKNHNPAKDHILEKSMKSNSNKNNRKNL